MRPVLDVDVGKPAAPVWALEVLGDQSLQQRRKMDAVNAARHAEQHRLAVTNDEFRLRSAASTMRE